MTVLMRKNRYGTFFVSLVLYMSRHDGLEKKYSIKIVITHYCNYYTSIVNSVILS